MNTSHPPLLVDEAKASHLTSLAKMISLVHSLEGAYDTNRWAPSDPPQLSKANCSKKLREAIMFSTCGSYAANKVEIEVPETVAARDRNKKLGYVDRYVDGWTKSGTPTMWLSSKWRKPKDKTLPAMGKKRRK